MLASFSFFLLVAHAHVLSPSSWIHIPFSEANLTMAKEECSKQHSLLGFFKKAGGVTLKGSAVNEKEACMDQV